MPERRGDFILTHTGLRFWPLDPRPEDIRIGDVAHALSNICRFTGHTRHFYSVAEHSCHVSDLAPPDLKLWGLLHDAAEAYLGDLARPTKYATFGDTYRQVEDRIMECVAERFCLPLPRPDEIHVLDDVVLETEAERLMPPLPSGEWTRQKADRWLAIRCWYPHDAKRHFLDRFVRLTGGLT